MPSKHYVIAVQKIENRLVGLRSLSERPDPTFRGAHVTEKYNAVATALTCTGECGVSPCDKSEYPAWIRHVVGMPMMVMADVPEDEAFAAIVGQYPEAREGVRIGGSVYREWVYDPDA